MIFQFRKQLDEAEKKAHAPLWLAMIKNKCLPPSSSLSDMNVSCIDSGATTLYFSSADPGGEIGASVTFFNVSTTEIYPSFCAIESALCPCYKDWEKNMKKIFFETNILKNICLVQFHRKIVSPFPFFLRYSISFLLKE